MMSFLFRTGTAYLADLRKLFWNSMQCNVQYVRSSHSKLESCMAGVWTQGLLILSHAVYPLKYPYIPLIYVNQKNFK